MLLLLVNNIGNNGLPRMDGILRGEEGEEKVGRAAEAVAIENGRLQTPLGRVITASASTPATSCSIITGGVRKVPTQSSRRVGSPLATT
mmetsp:Transcript_1944/g.4071  ORF Transcript_1944/g.4071 Transcript_1944/m.4071 type:complete len:89 (-) Transcript_1944:460-726(-)